MFRLIKYNIYYIYILDRSCYIGYIMQTYLVYNDLRSNWFNIIIILIMIIIIKIIVIMIIIIYIYTC